MISRFIAGKFRRPSGLLGRFIGKGMARGNAYEAKWTVSLLNIQPGQRILEIGFGPGVAIQYAAQKAAPGLVAGVDNTETMVKVARKRNAAAVKAGNVDLNYGEVSSLRYPDAFFDAVSTIHCIYFWAQPLNGLEEIRRVLKSDGVLAVTILPKDAWPEKRTPPADIFTLYSSDEVAQLLAAAGFREVRIEGCPQPGVFPGACVLGVK